MVVGVRDERRIQVEQRHPHEPSVVNLYSR